jgi:hypothetical protein
MPSILESQSETSYYTLAKVVYTYARRNPVRWRSLVGCRIRLQGRGFGLVIRVENDLTLWVQFDRAIGEESNEPIKLEPIKALLFERGPVTDVLFPSTTPQHILNALRKIRETHAIYKGTAELSAPSTSQESAQVNANLQAGTEKFPLRAIAQLRNISVAEARKYIVRVQRLCVEKPSDSSIAVACRQLAYALDRLVEVAVRASEIQGLSRQNIKPWRSNLQKGDTQSLDKNKSQRVNLVFRSRISSNYVLGQKESQRQYSSGNNREGISDNGDWESD